MRLMPTTLRNAAHRALSIALLPVVAAATARAAVAPPAPEDASLADRVEALASATFPAQVPTGDDRPFVFAQQAALFQAAGKLDPANVRYFRKRSEALFYGDAKFEDQYQSLVSILALQPGDEFTWDKLVDMKVGQDQAADKQIKTLTDLEGLNLPRAVLAHAGSLHAHILFDQGKEQAARVLLRSVLTNNPLDLDALQLQYRLLPAKSTPFEREQALLNILRANPLQPRYARLAALVAADAGLTQEAISFFSLGVNTSVALRRPDLQGALEWFAELFVADQKVDAYRNVQSLLASNPNNLDAWYLDLLTVRSAGFQQAVQDKDLQRATVVMSDRVAELINAALDASDKAATKPASTDPKPARATTRPFDAPDPFALPDVAPVVPLLKGTDLPPQLRQEFVEAVADLARLEIYFAHKPDVAKPLLDALAELQPANDPLLAQLRGLSSLISGDTKSALATLAGVARDDPIAAMGLVLAQWKDNPSDTVQADLEARKLLQDHPDGLIGAFLVEAITNPRVKLIPKNGMQQLQALIASFPHDLFTVGTNAARIYSIHVEPVDTARAWGEPLLVRVTLFNFSPIDLTIGNGGVIRPGLMFQLAPLIGAQPTAYPAFDTLAGPVVLHPRVPLSQVVRVDQAALASTINRTVRLAFQVEGKAATNADIGIGGYAVQIDKPFARSAVNDKAVADAQSEVNGVGADGNTATDRFTAVGILQAYVADLRTAHEVTPADRRNLINIAAALKRARSDPSPAVAAWADQAVFFLSDGAGRAAALNDLATSGDWRHRLLAAILATAVREPALQHKVLDTLKADPNPSIAAYATASVGLLNMGKLSPTTKPAAAAAPAPVH